jgi:hypothetical protein
VVCLLVYTCLLVQFCLSVFLFVCKPVCTFLIYVVSLLLYFSFPQSHFVLISVVHFFFFFAFKLLIGFPVSYFVLVESLPFMVVYLYSGVELRFSRHSPDWRVTQNFYSPNQRKTRQNHVLLSISTVCTSWEKRLIERRKKVQKITRQYLIPLAFGELASGYFHPCCTFYPLIRVIRLCILILFC